jgi:hypothetical protein
LPATGSNQSRTQRWLSGFAASAIAAGRTVGRVRVHQDPPTDYQRWERWLGQWNAAAGESIRYLTRGQAHEIGLLPDAGDEDWWLYDDTRLLVMRFAGSRRVQNEVITDRAIVRRACKWRDLSVRHSDLDDHETAATPSS